MLNRNNSSISDQWRSKGVVRKLTSINNIVWLKDLEIKIELEYEYSQ